MNVMRYRGQSASIAYDPDDELFVGRVLGVADVVGFHADSVGALKTAFHEAVDDYLAGRSAVDGRAPEEAA